MAFLRCEVWFVQHFSKHTFFVLALLGVFFLGCKKKGIWVGQGGFLHLL